METINAAGGYGPPGSGGGWGPPGGGYGAPPAPPAPPGGGYGSPPGSPPAGGFGGGPTGYGAPGAPAPVTGPLPAPDMGTDVNTTMPLLLNALGLVLCGASVIGAPLAILGLVFAIQAKNAKGMGDVLTARSKAKQSMFLFAGTILLGPVLFLVIWQYLAPASPRH